ncbi:MAG: radical SAM protein, partial [Candidatus Aminicenantes bacterium]|nr:radical SAM protein [Candidatus Aminicenantes bacterium]
MPKIYLIEPKAPNLHIYSQYKIPRLGPILLGTLMKKRGWEVEVVFEEAQAIDFEAATASDLVGISTITSTAPRAYALAEKIKRAGVPVLMGGPHVTFLAEEALSHCDYVIRGEAEHALMAFIDAWETDQDYSQVPNLSYTLNGRTVHNPTGRAPIDLDDFPYPDVSLLPRSPDSSKGLITIPVLTSRGCPFQCAFCSVTGLFGHKYRFRSTQNVIEALQRYNRPKNHVFFYDDNFAANRKRLKELLRAMLQEGFTFTWSAQVRVDVAQDEELLALM